MKPSRWWVLPLALLVSFLLQLTVIPFLAIRWVKPDLILVVTVLVGLLYGPKYGAVTGVFGGLLEDLFIGHFIGLFGLTRMLAGFLAGLVETRVYREPFLVPMTTSFAATLVSETILGLLLKAFGANPSLGLTFTNIVLPAAIYNAAIAPIVYRPLRRLKKETEDQATARF